MAKRKQKQNSQQSKRNDQGLSVDDDKLLRRPQRTREHTHVMIALTLASLVAGLLLVINLDRTTHSALAAETGRGASLHGWPMVFLERQFDSLPSFLASSQRYDWPWPAVKGEIRTMNYRNLMVDIGVGALMVILSYLLVSRVVFRYERWKLTWTSSGKNVQDKA